MAEKSNPKARSRAMLSCIAVGKYYDALDHLKYAGNDMDHVSIRQRERGAFAESVMRGAVAEFERTYGQPRRRDAFPYHVWDACHQPLNVLEFDMARQVTLRKAA